MPGRVFHNTPIPAEYTKVLVLQIIDMEYNDLPLDHVTPEGVKELGQAVNQFILWHRRDIHLDGPVSSQNQRLQLSQTPTSSPTSHSIIPSPPIAHEALQPPSPPKSQDHEIIQVQQARQEPLPSSSKDKDALQPPSPVKGMPGPPPKIQKEHPQPSSYKTIHRKLALYEPNTRSDPTDKFFEVMRSIKTTSQPAMSAPPQPAMSATAQPAQSYLKACEFESYEEDGEVYDREKLRLNDPVYMK